MDIFTIKVIGHFKNIAASFENLAGTSSKPVLFDQFRYLSSLYTNETDTYFKTNLLLLLFLSL